MQSRYSTDVLIVGSGPGGAVTAATLARAGRDVTILEAGPDWDVDDVPAFTHAEMLAKYRDGGVSVAFGPTKIAFVEARTLGGGSEINAGLYHRTPPEILDEWKTRYGLEGCGEGDLKPYFEKIEKDLSVSTLGDEAPPASRKLAQGASALGWKVLEVPRWFSDRAPVPGRQSMTRTYLVEASKYGARIFARSRATRIRKGRARWEVETRGADGRATTWFASALVLGAGATATPHLLRKNGLSRLAGRQFQLHPTIKVLARFSDEINFAGMGIPVHQVKEFAPRFSLGCSISSPPFQALSRLDCAGIKSSLRDDWTRSAIYYASIRPTGSGRILSLPGISEPIVMYDLSREDYRSLREGLQKLMECLFAAGADSLVPSLNGSRAYASVAELLGLPEEIEPGSAQLMTIHLFSSCPMGEDRSRCVADSWGRVHGHSNLRIADGSLLPSAPSVNPQGTIMALVLRNAQAWVEGEKK